MEIAAVDPLLLNMSEEPGIKAGMMAVILHQEGLGWDDEGTDDELPEKTLLCAGQSLSRELYPHLSPIFSQSGGFYSFELPDLRNKFILGVTPEGEFQMGDAVIYYEDIPDNRPASRDIRSHA